MNKFELYAFILLPILAGGSLVFVLKGRYKQLIKFFLAFSGAYILALCTLHLLPETYEQGGKIAGLFVLLGFILQITLEYFSGGVEHGHAHGHSHSHNHTHKHFPIAMFLSLCIHSFVEGMPLDLGGEGGNHFHHHGHEHHTHYHDFDGKSLLMGIALHNFPISFTLMTLFIAAGLSYIKGFMFLLIFGLSAILGTLAGKLIVQIDGGEFITEYISYLVALVVGMLMHISTMIIFESAEGHRLNALKLVSVALGILVAWFTL
ncbi:MAG: ZIP family metal transporter [Flavobacteriales bacterium]